MFEAWGRIIQRRRWLVLAVGLVAVALAGVWATGVFRSLQSSGGFAPPNSQSQMASNVLTRALGRDDADVVVLYRSAARTVDDPAYRAAVTNNLAALPAANVASEQTYWSTRSPQFVSADRRETYAVIQLKGADDSARQQNFDAIKGGLAPAGLRTQVGGLVPANEAIDNQVSSDIGKAEGFSAPVLAHPARRDLRRPGGRELAIGDRRHRHSRLIGRIAAAHPVHHRVDLLDQYHHDSWTGPGDRLRLVHGRPVP